MTSKRSTQQQEDKTMMPGWLKRRWDKGLTDPLGQNLALYFITFLISIPLSFIMSALSQEKFPVEFDQAAFSQTLCASVLPTAITMGLSTFIQNYDVVSKNKIEHSGQNVALLVLTMVYPLGYVLLSLYSSPWLNVFVYLGSAVIVTLGLSSISQIGRWHTKAQEAEINGPRFLDPMVIAGGKKGLTHKGPPPEDGGASASPHSGSPSSPDDGSPPSGQEAALAQDGALP